VFFFLSKILDIFLSPYTWGLVLFVAAVPWSRRQGRRFRRRRRFAIAGLALLTFFSLEPVANFLRYRLEHAVPSTYRPDVTYDAVILLGGMSDERVVAETGQPAYNDNVERLLATYDLLRTDKARFAILSGAAVKPELAEFGEARVLARQLSDWGIAPDRLIVEDEARNTRENATYSQAIAKARGFRNVVVVTSAFHMPRAVECFAAVGMEIDWLAVDYRASREYGSMSLLPRAGSLSASVDMIHEMTGRWIYRARGYAKAR
jgi:uncharacterized SAM-binding protein YcdF (DUF218 family)